MPIKVAAIQMCSGPDREANLSAADALIAEAADLGATLISLPENFSFLGRPEDKLKEAEDLESSHGARVSERPGTPTRSASDRRQHSSPVRRSRSC